ncbi:hypothetical protein BGW36DRAFT_360995 [Talaromyces proteolyticus]|uniref:Major facilitator superfamily (MFS) profile domain-containing protein n=1 Tax=Talaromyces proteolyticus TaxID=1131652 RepID=A0AAD4PZ12_9EURO|nr:uncharacterized protein BGW36DRAFT_360995 [Talaromyces proteolyticus]KAH8695292.1 hypothetical protein BGW36DRAFT_360995 [Talaromyces proteolyticus]
MRGISCPSVTTVKTMILISEYATRADERALTFVTLGCCYQIMRLLGLNSPDKIDEPQNSDDLRRKGTEPFVPESPRWPLSQNRIEDAKRQMIKLHNGDSEAEIDFKIEAPQHAQSIERKGSWSEVFNKDNRTRTLVAVIAMFGQQITGQVFASQYSAIFFQSEGFKNQAFLFNMLTNVASLVYLISTWFIIDQVSRRIMLLVRGSGIAIFMFIVGAIGVLSQS